MQKKIIQKMLAVMIAVASISTTPGLVSAAKVSHVKNVKKVEVKKNGRKKNVKKEKILRKKRKKAVKKKSEIEEDMELIEELIKNNALKNAEPCQNNTKNSVDQNINSIDIQNEIKMEEEKNNSLTINMLEKCSEDARARGYVVDSIVKLVLSGFFKNSSKEELLKTIDILKICAEDGFTKTNAVKAILQLAYSGYFSGWTKEEVLKIFEVLTKCADEKYVAKNVVDAIRHLNKNVGFASWEASEFRELLQSPLKFSKNDNAIKVVTTAISGFLPTINVRSKKSANIPQKAFSANENVNIQEKVDNNENKVSGANENVNVQEKIDNVDNTNLNEDIDIVKYILKLQQKNELKDLKYNDFFKISKSLLKYLESKDMRQKAVTIAELAKNKCFEQFRNSALTEICDMLLKCAKNDDVKPDVANAILELGKNRFVKINDKEEGEIFINLLDVLLVCDENNHDKKNVLSNIINFIENYYYRWKSPALTAKQRGKIVALFKAGLSDQETKKSASYAFALFYDKRVFREDDSDEILKIKDEVFKFIKMTAANSEDFDRKNFAFIIKVMIENNFLNQEEFIQAVEILEKCFESDSARRDVLYAIERLSYNKGNWSLSREIFLKIISIWEKYLDLPCKNKILGCDIFDVIRTFCENDAFVCLKDEDIARLIRMCSKNFIEDHRKCYSVSALCKMKAFGVLSKAEILKLIETLKQCFIDKHNDGWALEFISDAAEAGVFKNLKEQEALKILDILELCDYEPNVMRLRAAKIMLSLVDENLFKFFPSEKLPNVNRLLFKSNANRKSLLAEIANVVDTKFDKYSKDEMIMKIMVLLSECLKRGCNKTYISNAALKLFEKYYDKNTTKEKIIDLLEIFRQCSEGVGAKKRIIKATAELVKDGYLDGLSKEEGPLKVTDILIECSKNEAIKFDVMCSVIELTFKGYLEGYSQEERFKVFSIFKGASDQDIVKIIELFKQNSSDNVWKIMEYIQKAR